MPPLKGKHTIVYSRGGGLTCDQLLTLAQFVAFVEEFAGEFRVVDLPFWPFGAGFAAFAQDRICAVPTGPIPRRMKLALRVWERVTRVSAGTDVVARELVGRAAATWLDRARRSVHWRLTRWLERNASASAAGGLWIGDTRVDAYRELRAPRREVLYLDDHEVLADFRRRPMTVVCGSRIRCWNLVIKHQEAVRQVLRIREDLAGKSRAYVDQLRERSAFLIGVMIRQGDYREYADGRFYFPSEQYAAWMREALTLFRDRGRVAFLIASNVPQDPAVFAGLPVHFSTGIAGSPGHYLESLAELGGCDLVMTTASSFGCWGAFLGRAPVLPLVRAGQPLRADEALANLWDCTRHPDLKVAIW